MDAERRQQSRNQMIEQSVEFQCQQVVPWWESKVSLGGLGINMEDRVDVFLVSGSKHARYQTTVTIANEDVRPSFPSTFKSLLKTIGNLAQFSSPALGETVTWSIPYTNSVHFAMFLEADDPTPRIRGSLGLVDCPIIRWSRNRERVVSRWQSGGFQMSDRTRNTRGSFIEDCRVVCVVLSGRPMVRGEIHKRRGGSIIVLRRVCAKDMNFERPWVALGMNRY